MDVSMDRRPRNTEKNIAGEEKSWRQYSVLKAGPGVVGARTRAESPGLGLSKNSGIFPSICRTWSAKKR
jgi:hypothetical protein